MRPKRVSVDMGSSNAHVHCTLFSYLCHLELWMSQSYLYKS